MLLILFKLWNKCNKVREQFVIIHESKAQKFYPRNDCQLTHVRLRRTNGQLTYFVEVKWKLARYRTVQPWLEEWCPGVLQHHHATLVIFTNTSNSWVHSLKNNIGQQNRHLELYRSGCMISVGNGSKVLDNSANQYDIFLKKGNRCQWKFPNKTVNFSLWLW